MKLDRLQRAVPIVDTNGVPSIQFQALWQRTVESIEASLSSLQDQLDLIQAAQDAADAANSAAAAAQTAADNADTAAAAAQTAAETTAVESSLVRSFPTAFAGASPLEADSAGNVTIKNHTREYGDSVLHPDVPITGAVLATAQVNPAVVRIYYDDLTFSDGTPAFAFTVDPAASPVQGNGRHVIGAVEIPAAGTVDGGFVRPPGYTDVLP